MKIKPEIGDRVQWHRKGSFFFNKGTVVILNEHRFGVKWDATISPFYYNYYDSRIGIILNGLELAIRKAKA